MAKNPLYGDESGWVTLLIQEQVEFIRKHLCTGPCGQSSQVLQQRARIDAALKRVIGYLNEGNTIADEA